MQQNALLTLANMIASDEHSLRNEAKQAHVLDSPLMQLGVRAIFEVGLLEEGENGLPQRLHSLCSDWRIDELVNSDEEDGGGSFADDTDMQGMRRLKRRAWLAAMALRSLTTLIGKHESPRVRSAATRALLPVVGVTPHSIDAVLKCS